MTLWSRARTNVPSFILRATGFPFWLRVFLSNVTNWLSPLVSPPPKVCTMLRAHLLASSLMWECSWMLSFRPHAASLPTLSQLLLKNPWFDKRSCRVLRRIFLTNERSLRKTHIVDFGSWKSSRRVREARGASASL